MKSTLFVFIALTGLLASCRSRPVYVESHPHQQPTTVVVEKDHSHGNSCGHYYYNGHWYADPAHTVVIQ